MWRKLALLWQKKQLFKYVRTSNVQRIRALCQQGANLEWMDKKGNTPLILACMNQRLFNVAQTLIELGANINAHPPAFRYETPLYHAARSGLENTVNLLLFSGGANYDSQASLQVARRRRFTNIVRAIESEVCLFSGWMREFYGPALLGVLAPQLLDLLPPRFFSRRVWVVIVPTRSRNPALPCFELAVYANQQGAWPEVVMALRNPNLEEPEEMHPNTSVTIIDNDNPTKKSLKLAPSIEEGRQQLKWFCDACKGIPQPVRPPVVPQTVPPSTPPLPEAVEEGPIHHAISGSTSGSVPLASVGGANSENGRSGQCVICMDAPSVAACVPCGHIAGCMACLTEIKSNESVCPICRANIDQIMMVYPV